MLSYYYTLTPDDNGTVLIQFPDISEAAGVAESDGEVQANAADGLEVALQMYLDARRPIPMPDEIGTGFVSLPILQTSKIFLSNEMVSQGIRKAELARRLALHTPQVDRLLDLSHASKIEAVDAALQVLGRHLEVQLA